MAILNINNRIEKIKSLIVNAKNVETIKKVCKDEIKRLKGQGLASSTVRSYLTKYRKSIFALELSENYRVAVKESLKISAKAQSKIESDYAYKIAKQTGEMANTSLTSFENALMGKGEMVKSVNIKPKIGNLIEMIERAKQLIRSKSYIEVTLGLMMLTGRRNTEILKTATFEKVGKFVVKFDGQLKTKGSDLHKPYEIFTLCSSDLVIGALARLRKMRDFSELDTKQVNNKTGKQLSQKVKQCFGESFGEGNIKAYDLRAIYAQTIYQLIHEKQGISNTASYAKSLGHIFEKVDSQGNKGAIVQTTSKSYDKFLIKQNDIDQLRTMIQNALN